MNEVFEKFSNNYKRSLKIAANLALELNHDEIEPEHILYGLITQRGSVGAEIFSSLSVKTEEVKNRVIQTRPAENKKTILKPKFSEAAKQLIKKSMQIAYLNHHQYVGTEHLLAALIQINHQSIKNIFNVLNISEKNLTQQVVAILKSASKLPDLAETFKVAKGMEQTGDDQLLESAGDYQSPPKKYSILDLFGVDLTSQRFQKKIDPVIGRGEEIGRMIEILSRRTKNNPILLGDPGVGKTAIVEGLAKKILAGEVPEALRQKKIYALDLTATVAGTMYRGEFENRVKQIIDEVRQRPEIILFIDEIHNIVGAGSASGSMDAANILKPALARGEIRCIGATTFEDYRKTIENDPALDRRFQVVKIAEPTAEATKEILSGIKKYFENFHQVRITDSAIETAISLSQRYLPEKFLPDKAIDLIDEAAAAKRVNRKISSREKKIKNLEEKIAQLEIAKKQTILTEDFEQAIKLKKEITALEQNCFNLKEKIGKEKFIGEITGQEIAKVITRMTGIPADDLINSEKKLILNLDKKLQQKIIGQEPAVKAITEFIKRAKAGLNPNHKPLASFIFFGPSGVGKTYTAKILAQTLFRDEKSLIKIDMSEYAEKFNVSKLIGAPAGYIGYKESGQLTEKIKHKPYAVVLLDEIEKANAEIFDLLLQVLEDGYLTDAAGAKINFQNTIIIMTSNLGSRLTNMGQDIGFDAGSTQKKTVSENYNPLAEKTIKEIKNHFKAEFINRVDRLIYFQPLKANDLQKIVRLELANLSERLISRKITLNFEPNLIKLIASRGQTNQQGARAIKKIIQELVETPLAERILNDEIASGHQINLSWKNKQLTIEKTN